jgi:hypothetical protein
MTQQLRAFLTVRPQVVDDDLRQAVKGSGGDVVSALRAALIANAFLVNENAKWRSRFPGDARGVKN